MYQNRLTFTSKGGPSRIGKELVYDPADRSYQEMYGMLNARYDAFDITNAGELYNLLHGKIKRVVIFGLGSLFAWGEFSNVAYSGKNKSQRPVNQFVAIYKIMQEILGTVLLLISKDRS